MENQKYKTTAMIERSLRDHRRNMLCNEIRFWIGLFVIALVVFLVVV